MTAVGVVRGVDKRPGSGITPAIVIPAKRSVEPGSESRETLKDRTQLAPPPGSPLPHLRSRCVRDDDGEAVASMPFPVGTRSLCVWL